MDQSLLKRSDANRKALDALNGRLDHIDDNIEGVAYRLDIKLDMTRREIEAKIAQVAARAERRHQVARSSCWSWWPTCAT